VQSTALAALLLAGSDPGLAISCQPDFLTQTHEQLPPNPGAAEFGRDVATFGDYLIVGAEQGADVAVYMYKPAPTYLQQIQTTTLAPGMDTLVAMDANQIAVGGLSRIEVLVRLPAVPDPVYGPDHQISISEELTALAIRGNVLVAGFADLDDLAGSGRIIIAERTVLGWIEVTIPAPPSSVHVGHSVDLENGVVVVGASGNPIVADGFVHTFVRTGLAQWIETPKLSSPTPDLNRYGFQVALDGATLAVGAPLQDVGADVNAGAVFMYELNPFGLWQLVQTVAPVSIPEYHFGEILDLGAGLLAVSHPGQGTKGQVVLYVDTPSGWDYCRTLTGEGNTNQNFGRSVALAANGVVVGSPRPTSMGGGSVYLYSDLLLLFEDGFESGDVSAWSQSVP
jgi:hypothetical protein